MPNGGYDPIPIDLHDEAVARAKHTGAFLVAAAAIERAAAMAGCSFEEATERIVSERSLREAMKRPKG